MLWRGGSHDHGEGMERERVVHRRMHKNISPNPLVWKMRRAEFHKFLQPAGLEDRIKVSELGWDTT